MSLKSDRWTVARIQGLKGKKFACVTATDTCTAQWAEAAEIPLILVGDSLGMTTLGFDTTLSVTLEMMLHHTAAVVRGRSRALVVADMPFLSYQISIESALRNAGRFLQEAGADAVKIEGGEFRAPLVRELVRNGIPVLGHIGLLPQSVLALGGYRVVGRTPEQIESLIADACALEDAGAFAIVLEAVRPDVARRVTERVAIPTIGIGAGPHCDGQILVIHDLLGLNDAPVPRFVQQYAHLGAQAIEALRRYREDVARGEFPGPEHSYD